MKKDKIQILKVLVGSHAHGLADLDSDHDYRAVYVNATTDILSIGHKYKGNHWVEGEAEDQTSYEIGHFLKLATKCNPTILEVLRAPIMDATPLGIELIQLFPYIWNPNDAYNAFRGYSTNQRKKMLDKKDDRGPKFACAYLRTLNNLNQLLGQGTFNLEIPEGGFEGGFRAKLLKIRKGDFTPGDVIDHAEDLLADANIFMEKYQLGLLKQEPDLNKVHEFLMKVRKQYWELPK